MIVVGIGSFAILLTSLFFTYRASIEKSAFIRAEIVILGLLLMTVEFVVSIFILSKWGG